MRDDFAAKERYSLEDVAHIMRILRSPGGCPWDAQQTHESIRKNLIEECYEVIEAINKADSTLLCEELGDLYMQVVFHAQMAEDAGHFSLEDVADGLCNKLIERHPHVFGDMQAQDAAQALSNWDAMKRSKKGQKAGSDPMKTVPRELPALMRSAKVQQKAAIAGFDWPDISGALDKLHEETRELEQAIAAGKQEAMLDELGDLLFSAVNVSRFIKVDAEEALTAACDKFIRRFEKVEQLAQEKGMQMPEASLEELDKLWEQAKR